MHVCNLLRYKITSADTVNYDVVMVLPRDVVMSRDRQLEWTEALIDVKSAGN